MFRALPWGAISMLAGCLSPNPDWQSADDSTAGATTTAATSAATTSGTTLTTTGGTSAGTSTSATSTSDAGTGTATSTSSDTGTDSDTGPQPASCDGLEDLVPCDDGNICSTQSVCQASQCVPVGSAGPCDVANSEDDFASTQGEAGWYYGYWDFENDGDGVYDFENDFLEMSWDGSVWTTELQFHYLAWWGTHPRSNPFRWTVRRWVSDIEGPAMIRVSHQAPDDSFDGTLASIRVDGVEKMSLMSNGLEVVEGQVEVELRVGTTIDLMVSAIDSDAADTTNSSMRVESPQAG